MGLNFHIAQKCIENDLRRPEIPIFLGSMPPDSPTHAACELLFVQPNSSNQVFQQV